MTTGLRGYFLLGLLGILLLLSWAVLVGVAWSQLNRKADADPERYGRPRQSRPDPIRVAIMRFFSIRLPGQK